MSDSQGQSITVNPFNSIYPAFIRLVKQVRLIPKTIANAAEERQRLAGLRKNEAERLDRICNPSKYRGK